jgi:hypothetical protein
MSLELPGLVYQLDEGSLPKPGRHDLGAMTMSSILKEMVGAMLGHKEFKLSSQQLIIPDAIHHLCNFQELQLSSMLVLFELHR